MWRRPRRGSRSPVGHPHNYHHKDENNNAGKTTDERNLFTRVLILLSTQLLPTIGASVLIVVDVTITFLCMLSTEKLPATPTAYYARIAAT